MHQALLEGDQTARLGRGELGRDAASRARGAPPAHEVPTTGVSRCSMPSSAFVNDCETFTYEGAVLAASEARVMRPSSP